MGNRIGQCDKAEEDASAPSDVDRPCRIEKSGLLTPLVLNDTRADADIRKQAQALKKDADKGHQSEGFREQQASEDQVARKAERLAATEFGQGPN